MVSMPEAFLYLNNNNTNTDFVLWLYVQCYFYDNKLLHIWKFFVDMRQQVRSGQQCDDYH